MKPLLLIPHYNHAAQIESVLQELDGLDWPLMVVDDGSEGAQWSRLKTLCEDYPRVDLRRLQPNQGKGAAVLQGIAQARDQGYTHALQFDADGQHEIDDIPAMLELAAGHPRDIISGLPQFGDDIPSARKWGRRFCDLWCRIETLSGVIEDAMCGFRVYPVAETCRLAERYHIARRMGFDIDILVKGYWAGIGLRYMPTAVRYPEDGVSHFRYLRDNVAITWMHIKLVFGMLPRSPALIARHFR